MIDILECIYWFSFFTAPILLIWCLTQIELKKLKDSDIDIFTIIFFSVCPFVNTLVLMVFLFVFISEYGNEK